MTEDNNTLEALVKAMSQIQAELQQMNRTLSAMAAQNRTAGAEPTGRAPAGRAPVGRPPARTPVRAPRATGGYGRSSEMSGGPATEESGMGARFPKKKAPSRPKGKLPPKKGNGYPKKPR